MGDRLRVALFLEDAGHQRFIDALVRRLADEEGVAVEIDVRNARGGASQLDGQFTRFLRDNATLDQRLDLVVLIRDTDCRGVDTIKTRYFRLIDDVGYPGEVVVGAPEPHIECWYLSDPPALQRVLSSGFQAPVPDSKCGSGRFKRLLSQTVKDAGVEPAEGESSTPRNCRRDGHLQGLLQCSLARCVCKGYQEGTWAIRLIPPEGENS